MAFCRFCGKELVDGKCDCQKFQEFMEENRKDESDSYQKTEQEQQYQQEYQQEEESYQEYQQEAEQQYQQTYEKRHEPFLVQSFQPDFSSFSSFVSSVRDQSGVSEPSSNAGDPFEYNVPIVPDCVKPEENEVVVKQYNIARLRTRLKFMKAEGRLMVTNRRILFRAAGTSLTGNLLQEHEFDLDELAGIEMHKDYKFSLLNLFGSIAIEVLALYLTIELFSNAGNGGTIAVGVILGLLGIVPTVIVYKHPWLKLLCAGISVACFQMAIRASMSRSSFLSLLLIVASIVYLLDLLIVCFVPNLVIKIKVKGAHAAIHIGSQRSLLQRRGENEEYSGFVEVLPWEDTVMAMNELGALIDDLKKQGDYAIDKWSK